MTKIKFAHELRPGDYVTDNVNATVVRVEMTKVFDRDEGERWADYMGVWFDNGVMPSYRIDAKVGVMCGGAATGM